MSTATTPASTLGETSSASQVFSKGLVVRVLSVHCCSIEPWVYPCANTCSVPMLQSSNSTLVGLFLGFLDTSLKSNNSSKGDNPLGKKIYFNCNISNPSCFLSISFDSISSTLSPSSSKSTSILEN
jgi:hypothetical protein